MSIPLILASQSPSRQKVLVDAGIMPTIHVSHIDEPAALADAARKLDVSVDDLSVEQRVTILAQAKARSVYRTYRQVAQVSQEAGGDQITAFPLLSPDLRRDRSEDRADLTARSKDLDRLSPKDRQASLQRMTVTRDFSQLKVPVQAESLRLALGKTPGFSDAKVGPLIVGCDSMFLFKGQPYGKPHSPAVARERLQAMRGQHGELWTGHCLIDFAAGRQALAASRALVHFADYSDQEIDRYIATGEPLEVAGSFTLEGYGSAFIEYIDGDPHGIMGISLPLLRKLSSQLGLEWTDLWNTLPVPARDQGPKPSAAAQAASPIPPKKNVHQPGDGWVDCACGRRHWGLNGASGILLVRRDPISGKATHIAMQHRAVWSAEGGTWGIPGGASADGENPIEGALRESYEEANINPDDIAVTGSYREDHGPWSYTTVFAFEKPGHRVDLKANDDESMSIEWVPIDEVPDRKLLTALRTDWPRFRRRIDRMAARLAK
ncbi:septum formation protein Maf [Bifidobacterium aemilianum]|uniref:Nucleoside triphosphate pyrophosphatase n=1 Tax=Bifidobacterium aemilianum TaxID=2493120 RepID=A0A366K8K9_9BIFI|nr:Maf family protein [Bifidobacterium aemilianum]RBP97657.1 septum formation protein Maf [Bifidobacterium aemilianum]